MAAIESRRRVYVRFVHGKTAMRRVLDLGYVDGKPVAVVSWVNIGGIITPGQYVQLDPARLRRSVPAGCYWYDGEIVSKPGTEP
jgi:hypothetical protein